MWMQFLGQGVLGSHSASSEHPKAVLSSAHVAVAPMGFAGMKNCPGLRMPQPCPLLLLPFSDLENALWGPYAYLMAPLYQSSWHQGIIRHQRTWPNSSKSSHWDHVSSHSLAGSQWLKREESGTSLLKTAEFSDGGDIFLTVGPSSERTGALVIRY